MRNAHIIMTSGEVLQSDPPSSPSQLEPEKKNVGTDFSYKRQIKWLNAVLLTILHILGSIGWFLVFTGYVKFWTIVWVFFIIYSSGEGVTMGAHRLFTHRSYKATPSLRAVLILLQTMAGQNTMYHWCRDHRLHHRYSDTDADPHNSRRGFFFSHIGWLMVKKHPYVKEFGKTIDMTDLQADWMVMFQKKYFLLLYIPLGFLLPVWIPVHLFGETWWASVMVCYFARYIYLLNGTWLVNSAAHLYGTRPYDRNLQPVEAWFVSLVTLGEGWHNYHHAYPWDYKAAELSMHLNFSATLIRFCEKLGLAYDLKTVPQELVDKRIMRTGDGSHYRLTND